MVMAMIYEDEMKMMVPDMMTMKSEGTNMISNPAATKSIPQCKQRHCSGPQRPLQQNGMKIDEDYKI